MKLDPCRPVFAFTCTLKAPPDTLNKNDTKSPAARLTTLEKPTVA